MGNLSPRRAATVSNEVVSAADFDEQIEIVRSQIVAETTPTTEHGKPNGLLVDWQARARRRASLETQIGLVLPDDPIVHPGLRGRVSGLVKSGVRRLLYWYIEPSWQTQQKIDREIARLADTDAAALAALCGDVERLNRELLRLQDSNLALQRDAAALRQQQPAPGETE